MTPFSVHADTINSTSFTNAGFASSIGAGRYGYSFSAATNTNITKVNVDSSVTATQEQINQIQAYITDIENILSSAVIR